MIIDLDNSKRSAFSSCQKKFYWAYVRHLQPKIGSSALRFGATFHAFLEGYRESKITAQSESVCKANALNLAVVLWNKESEGREFLPDYRSFELCNYLFDRYLDFYKIDDIVPEKVEFVFSNKIIESGENEIYYSGRIDCLGYVCGDTKLAIIDDKTTSFSLQAVASQLERSAQIIGYIYALREFMGYKNLSTAYINASYIKCSKSKTTELYGEPTIAFGRYPYIFSEHDITEFRKMLYTTSEQLIYAIQSKHWTMNFDECYGKYGTCPYLSLCKMASYPDSYIKENFVEKEWNITRSIENKNNLKP